MHLGDVIKQYRHDHGKMSMQAFADKCGLSIVLQPLNPAYDPKVYDYNDELNPIQIAGVVVEIRRKV